MVGVALIERLTDEQLRAVARSFTEQSIEAAAVNEALALRAHNSKLEAALREARIWVVRFDNADDFQRHATLRRIDAALPEPCPVTRRMSADKPPDS